jgi:hypothetical protein
LEGSPKEAKTLGVKHYAFSLLILSTACATTEIKREDYIPRDKWPEEVTKLPDDADKMEVPEKLKKAEWAKPIKKGQVAKEAGVLMSPAKAWRFGQHKIEADALRDLDVADRNVWGAQRALYENQIHEDKKEIDKLQPTFWDRYGVPIMTTVGFVVGAGVTIGIAAAINEVQQ